MRNKGKRFGCQRSHVRWHSFIDLHIMDVHVHAVSI